MPGSQLARWSGWAFILGGLALATILNGSDAVTIPGSVISAILLLLGLSGLRRLYGAPMGRVGRHVVPLALIGMAVLCLPLALLGIAIPFLPAMGLSIGGLMEDGIWILLFAGPAAALLGLTVFGLAALRARPMPRLNWLPAAAGFWYPLVYFLFAGYIFTHHGAYPHAYLTTFQTASLIQSFALCVLGAILVSGAAHESADGGAESSQGTPWLE